LNQWQASWDGINVSWHLPVSEIARGETGSTGSPWRAAVAEVHAEIRRILPPAVAEHSVRTANVARRLASVHGEDEERVELAGLVHDLADGYTDAQLLELAETYGISIGPIESSVPRLLHGPVGAEILRREWGVADEEILTAVRDHVSGAVDTSPMAKLLFLADKLEPERAEAIADREAIEALAERDLDAAVLRVVSRQIAGLMAHERLIDERLVALRNRLLQGRARAD
jgi:predicted HD superfamily hydrolase involved in NAD metabolism